MSHTYASSFLRQCTGAIVPSASRTLRCNQSTAAAAFRARRARLYSTQPGEQGNASATAQSSTEGEKKAADDAAPSAEEECQRKLKAKEDEAADLTGRLRYLQADFLNLQRNAAREKEQTRDFAISRFAGDLLETVDVLALALKSVPSSALADAEAASSSSNSPNPSIPDTPTPESVTSATSTSPSSSAQSKSAAVHLRELHHGVEMTHRLLLSTLFKYGVAPFDPTGDAFDPHKHEALYQAPVPGVKPGTVLECQKTGYTIKDRTLRAAQVGVAAESPSQ